MRLFAVRQSFWRDIKKKFRDNAPKLPLLLFFITSLFVDLSHMNPSLRYYFFFLMAFFTELKSLRISVFQVTCDTDGYGLIKIKGRDVLGYPM